MEPKPEGQRNSEFGAAPAISHSRFSGREWLGAFLLLAILLAAYYPALHGEFLWDDADWTLNATSLYESRDAMWRMWSVPTTLQQYYPLTGTTFWLDHHLWGRWTFPYHLENVLLHFASVLLFWRLLLRLKVRGAWLAAAIIALHPVMVESAGWITERKNVLSLALFLASLLAYGRSVHWWASPEVRRDWKFYALALILLVFALTAKVTAFVLPPVILLLGWWKLGSVRWKRDLLPLVPFFAIAIGFSLGANWMERHHLRADGAGWNLTFMERVLLAGRACCFYVGKFLWPVDVSFVYPRWRLDASSLVQWLYPVVVLAAFLAAWLARRRIGRGTITAMLCFIGALFPVLGFMNVYGMLFSFVADRWTYFSSLALAALIASAAMEIRDRWRRPVAFYSVVVLYLCALATLTWIHAGSLRNAEVFWQTVLRQDPRSWLASNELGVAVAKTGRLEDALPHFRESIALNPNFANAHANLGGALLNLGRTKEAINGLQTAAALGPGKALVHFNLGNALCLDQRMAESVPEFQKALELEPSSYAMGEKLGIVLAQLGRTEEAIVHFKDMQKRWPEEADSYGHLGNILIQTGHVPEAVAQFEQALRLSPSHPTLLNNLSLILSSASDPSVRNAARALELAQTLDKVSGGKEPTYLSTLAAAWAGNGRFKEALEAAEKAAQIASEKGDASQVTALRQQAASYKERIPVDAHR